MKARAILSLLRASSDEEAMERVRALDDFGEFDRLVRRWEEPIRRLCIRMTGDIERGEELKQDVFLRLFEKRKDYKRVGRFSTFLWRMALNACYDELRKRGRRKETAALSCSGNEADEVPVEEAGPDLQAVSAEEGEMVRQALLELPEIYRSVLVLRHYHDLKLSQIAEILEIPEGTVNSRMAEALARLSRSLEPRLKSSAMLEFSNAPSRPRPPGAKQSLSYEPSTT